MTPGCGYWPICLIRLTGLSQDDSYQTDGSFVGVGIAALADGIAETPGDGVLLRPAPVERRGRVPALAKVGEVRDVALPAARILERVIDRPRLAGHVAIGVVLVVGCDIPTGVSDCRDAAQPGDVLVMTSLAFIHA